MRRWVAVAGLLAAIFVDAQKKDSIRENSIDGVILNQIKKKDTESSNKMPLKFIENTQVYSSVDKVVLENQNIFTVDDALRNVTGLQKMWNATNRSGDGGAYLNMRGFIAQANMRNGIVSPVSGSMDAVNVEKIEVLKGPSATMFGSSETSYGGLVNRVTKQPYADFGGKITAAAGSYNYYRVQADANAPLNKEKTLLFRINTAYTTSGSFQNKDLKNSYFAFVPALKWKISDRADLNLEYEAFESRAQAEQNVFFMFAPSLAPYNLKDMRAVENAGLDYKSPYIGTGLYNNGRTRNFFARLNYNITDHVKSTTLVSNSYSFSDGFSPYFYLTTKTYSADGSPLGLWRGDQSTKDSRQTFVNVQQNFNFDFNIGNVRNRLLIGGDYLHEKNNQLFIYETADFVPFSGNYDYTALNGAKFAAMYAAGGYGSYPIINTKDTYSGYISDVATLAEGLNVMASVRYESNKFNGGTLGSAAVAPYKQGAFSPKFGVVYEIIKDKFSVFGNFQNSFKSNGYYAYNANLDTKLAKPETANQWEGGIKTNLLNGKVNATLSYYDIKVKNTLQTIGYTPNYFAIQNADAQRSSKGVELEVNAYLVKGFSVIAGLSYNDSKYTVTADPTVQNMRPGTSASPWLANFSANYQFVDGGLKGLGFGIGGNYASENKIFNSTAAVFSLPKYFVMNANAFYDAKKFRIGVNVDNFTNEHYWIGYSTGNAQKLMNATGSFTYKF